MNKVLTALIVFVSCSIGANEHYIPLENQTLERLISDYHEAGKTKQTYLKALQLALNSRLIVANDKILPEQHNKHQPPERRKIKAVYADNGKIILPVFTSEKAFSNFEYKYAAYAETNAEVVFSTAINNNMNYVVFYNSQGQALVVLPRLYNMLLKGKLPG